MNDFSPHPAHVALTIASVAAYAALKYYGIDMGVINDIVSMVAGASGWGHCADMARASAAVNDDNF